MTTDGTYQRLLLGQKFRNGELNHKGDRKLSKWLLQRYH